jgi:hypothetical protein
MPTLIRSAPVAVRPLTAAATGQDASTAGTPGVGAPRVPAPGDAEEKAANAGDDDHVEAPAVGCAMSAASRSDGRSCHDRSRAGPPPHRSPRSMDVAPRQRFGHSVRALSCAQAIAEASADARAFARWRESAPLRDRVWGPSISCRGFPWTRSSTACQSLSCPR